MALIRIIVFQVRLYAFLLHLNLPHYQFVSVSVCCCCCSFANSKMIQNKPQLSAYTTYELYRSQKHSTAVLLCVETLCDNFRSRREKKWTVWIVLDFFYPRKKQQGKRTFFCITKSYQSWAKKVNSTLNLADTNRTTSLLTTTCAAIASLSAAKRMWRKWNIFSSLSLSLLQITAKIFR